MRPNHSATGASRHRAIAGLLACAAAALIVPASPLQADEAQPFRLCADPTNLPFSSDSSSKPGLYVEIGQALAQALGRPIAYDWYKSYFGKRTVRVTLLGKQCDAMIGLPRSADFMGPAVIFSDAIAKEGYALVATKESAKGAAIGGIEGLKGKRVAVQFASTPQNLLASRDDIQKVTVLSPEEGMQALDQGRADVAFIWGPVAGWLNKTSYGGRYQIELTEGEGLSWDAAIGFAKASTKLRDRVNAVLPQLQGKIGELAVKYGLPGGAPVRFGAAPTPAPVTTGTGSGAGVAQVANVVATETKGDAVAPGLEAVGAGKEIFNGTCAHCHGPDAIQSERKIDLRLLRHRYGDEMREKYLTTVQEGRPNKGMPAWKEVYTEDQVNSIYSFLLTVQVESND
ncbi:amino acid ABC transporter substrate-binding protein, PAAT family [Bradyrhizobium yuanmingense]|uniref:Amino acid ABC transporter substrate-binding protein, PAAT family n=1 Tax=Bradyrhizobium yuanmingense TaxID=108015 RepID=A0A1C3WNS4_9BRAD|nr:transporter substrate-binding domain-containing protein [Bradyrhizobium yuanmingense]TWI24274.1 ABC-type amino acid transport substrate-binding protein [Bradyrhizobium yuanmingense]SCB41742.1 amino acid ABC transporter substrate-binding protein, PAAT family [Bradyrhizobium yuanmingense]